MSSYKVPQDVEAEDKLLGPFSFRQFIYLIAAAIGIALMWGLGRLFLPLAVFPLPIVLLFGALALPLKKDQPMETYLLAILSFYIKPRKRLWQPDGIQSLVEITAPKTVEVQRTKDITRTEAARRLSYLADVVDSQGWSVRGIENPDDTNSMVSDVYYEAQQTDDILDDNNTVSRSFDQRIEQTAARQRQEAIERMHSPTPAEHSYRAEQSPTNPYNQIANYTSVQDIAAHQQQHTDGPDPAVVFNPYPNIRQSVVAPEGNRVADYHKSKQPEATPASATTSQPTSPTTPESAPSATPQPAPDETPVDEPSEKPVSPDIINLANNSDLSIQTIANEAGRISKKEKELKDDEVVISLR